MKRFEDEVQSRWGKTEQFKQSAQQTKNYTQADFQAAKIDQEAATELFVFAFGNGHGVKSEFAKVAVIAHREAITKWFYECSIEMQKNLALLYIQDPRFKEYYDGRIRGLAQYVHDAIMAQ
jgi:hypothetical protein